MKRKHYSSYLVQERIRRVDIEKDLSLRLRQHEAIAELGEYALTCDDLPLLFDKITQTVAETLGMEFCNILELLPGENELLLRSGVGWKEGLVGQARVENSPSSLAGYTLMSETPVIVEDLRADARFTGPPLLTDHQVISGMSVKIAGDMRPFGVLGVYSTRYHKFYPHDTRFIQAVANILASAIGRSTVEEKLRHSRDELAIILRDVTEGITVQDQQGNIIYANNAAANILGYANAEEALAASLAEIMQKFTILDEEGHPFPGENLPGRRVLQGATRASAIVRFRVFGTGQERWSIVDATPILDSTGQAVQAVNIFRDITDLVISEKNQKFLSEAGSLLASSLDYKTTLSNIAQLAVTDLADWCSINLLTDEQEAVRLAVAHKDPDKVKLAREYQERYPPNFRSDNGIGRVLRSGETVYYPLVQDEMLAAAAVNDEHLEIIRALGMKSVIIAPLKAHGETFGAITFIWAESDRRYTERDVELANELSLRASLAIENARLFEQAKKTNTELERRVEKRTEQLQRSLQKLSAEIEERRKTEEALKKSETMLNSLFESAPDGILLVDGNGKILRVNRQTQVLLKYSREELSRLSIEDLIPASMRSQHNSKRNQYMKEMVTRTMGAGLTLYALRKDGVEFPVDIMLSPVKTEQGELVICAIRDITEQKRLQMELAETHRRFVDSIEDERLLISQELHDGPIQDLIGLSFYLNSLGDFIQTPEQLEELRDASQNAQTIIQNLREICGDLRPPTLSRFGLEKSIRSHLEKIQKLHPEITIREHLMSDGTSLPERTRLALFRIYQNSINNIIRHARAKNVVVEFRVQKDEVLLFIQDDGQGFTIPNKWINLVREGHYGLVGMKERVEAIGGNLSIETELGKGTIVRATVPIKNLAPSGVR